MDAVKFIKERGRVCRFYHPAGDCYQCPAKDCECSALEGITDSVKQIIMRMANEIIRYLSCCADEDFVCGVLERIDDGVEFGEDEMQETVPDIGNAPTIDAVPVVRCKNCKYHYWEQEPCHGRTEYYCALQGGLVKATRESFCGYGVKKEEGDELSQSIRDGDGADLCVAAAPTVDAAAEKFGTWLRRIPPLGAGNVLSYCSDCGFTADVETPFCPWCGKKKQHAKEENELQ